MSTRLAKLLNHLNSHSLSNVTQSSCVSNNEQYSHPKLKKIQINSEDGRLREVIFGKIDDFVLPKYNQHFDYAHKKILRLVKQHPNELFKDVDPVWYKEIKTQMENVVKLLESKGIIVYRPEKHSETENKNYALSGKYNTNIYNRDSVICIGDTAIEGTFCEPSRNRNKHAVRYVTMELMRNGNKVVAAPHGLDTFNHNHFKEVLLEGGDVEIDGENIYIGMSGTATNRLGYQFVKNLFPQHNVYLIEIDQSNYPHLHLDCVMVAFSKWGIILPEAIIGGINGLPAPLRKKQWIKMTLEESKAKFGNIIAIAPNEIVMPKEAERLIKEIKQNVKYIDIINEVPYGSIGKLGGCLRCNTCPIYRD